jgi:hypothetical protein
MGETMGNTVARGLVGHDFGRMLARAGRSLPAASENANGVLVAQPRSHE